MNSILERVNLVCQGVRNSAVQGITFKKVIGCTRSAFKYHDCDIKVTSKKDKTLDSSEFYVNAYYDAEHDFNNETAIEIIVHHNFNDIDRFNTLQVTEFLIQIYDATVHEYRHRSQSVKRNHTVYSDHNQSLYTSYLKDPDELDAYSLSIAIELLRHMSKDRARRYMSRITVLSKMRSGMNLVSPNLKTYIDHFGMCNLTRNLSKKVYKHIELIDNRYIFV
jgi:hypothetical protein